MNKDRHHSLYKVPFCRIYQQSDNVIRTYKMEFSFDFKTIRDCDFLNAKQQRGYCGSVQGYDLSWRVCNSKVDEHELYVDYANILALVDADASNAKGKTSFSKDDSLSVIAFYSREGCRPNSRWANLRFLEQSSSMGTGITSVSPITQLLSCHALLLHLEAKHKREEDFRSETALYVGKSQLVSGINEEA